jgi:hypothetical protein
VDLSPVTLKSASGHFVDCALNVLLPLEINERYSKKDTWQPSMGLALSDRMLGLRPIDQTSTSGHPMQAAVLSLTTLFIVDAYK